ncbi:M14 family zinc carboxypeptidase [Gilvibacter sediminis]|uniref:M14 family zinc carboxypeptidase n=1 Tax=Gilvibacter sediminis TaxID=379071 RepID=UPI00234FC418|nr:M14 family zinc carboxypeptidase [Gilvibacter sediminis]MDC7998173.1 M14 family zinc carboxypeptidase [Gilvibacter sediminis]
MNPKLPLKAITFVMALLVSTGLFAQETAKRIRIDQVSPALAKTLVENGIDLRCGVKHTHEKLQLELQPTELAVLQSLNVAYEVVIDDLYAHYQEVASKNLPAAKAELARLKAMQAAAPKTSFNNATQDSFLQDYGMFDQTFNIPANFNLGASFGGCLTISEVEAELDQMRSLYPGLVSAKADASPSGEVTWGNNSSGTANDWNGQTVYYVRMTSDQASAEGSKPAMLFTSMIHSREVNSMMSNIYFMWYLLENYGSDDRVTHLLDNNEIYFIPVVNPDGLRWNETITPGGGGLQRKNLNPSSGSSTVSSSNTSRGVDLNRNFDYFWGTAGSGSSGTPSSDSYRGTSPWSEPESRILRDFMLWDGTADVSFPWSGAPLRDFKIVLMNHTFANSIPHPYGGNPGNVTGRENEMHAWHAEMTRYNRYVSGATIFTPANGIADDWMLGGPVDSNGSVGSGENILGTTPEIGGTGFWPDSFDILPISQNVVRHYLSSIYYGGKYAKFHDMTQSDITSLTPTLTFGIERVGQTASDFNLVITPGTNMTGSAVTLAANGLGISGAAARTNVSTPVSLDTNIQVNDKFTYTISLENDEGVVIYETEIEKVYSPSVLFEDNPDSDALSNWSATGSWNNSSLDGFTGTRSVRSSNTIPYSNSSSGTLTSDPIDISGAGEVLVQFYTKYDIERNFDYVEVLGSTNGTDYFPLVGRYNKPEATASTNDHNAKSAADESFQSGSAGMVYDGDTFDEWVMEEIVIDPIQNSYLYGANSMRIRFVFANDSENEAENYNYNFDGFFIDDFKVIQTSTSVEECALDVVDTFPLVENFDGGRGVFRPSLGDDGNWTLNTGGTPSGTTGPDEGNGAAAYEGGQYLYTEASTDGLGSGANVILESTCLDLTNWYDASIEFDYHMYGSNMGTLAFEISTDNGINWTQLFTVSGQQQGSETAAWTTETINLPNATYAGEVIRVRFNATTGAGFRSDISIDNFVLNATEVCSVATTWDGSSWDNGTPTTNVQAIIAGDYDMNDQPSINACAITVQSGATLTVAASTYALATGDITVDAGGNLVVSHEGSVVQVDDSSVATNNGSITVSKTTPSLGFREFSVMSSPMSASTRDVAFAGAFRAFGHNTANFDTNDAVTAIVGDAINFVDQTGNDRIPLTGSESLDVARGYLVVPFGPGSPTTYTANYTQGTLNNGQITKSIIYNGSPEESANLIGNPYASAIDADAFLAANAHIPELYFWNQNTAPATGPGYLAYSMEDISQYNSSGGIAAASDPGNIPDQFVPSGQGFGVKPTSNANAVFNNGMRVTGNNVGFKSAPATASRPNRIWLQMDNATYTESTSTTLVAFLNEATDGLDVGFDSKRIGTYVSLFSTVEDLELGIQGRSPFVDDAVIPMGFRTLLEETTAYTISIAQLEGEDVENATIYIKDLETGVVTNLSERNYVFTADQGHYPERFVVFFKDRVLDVEDLGLSENTVLLYPNPASDSFTIQNTSNQMINEVTIYDIQGRVVFNTDMNGQSEQNIFVGQLPSGVYMVRMQSDNTDVIKRLIKN